MDFMARHHTAGRHRRALGLLPVAVVAALTIVMSGLASAASYGAAASGSNASGPLGNGTSTHSDVSAVLSGRSEVAGISARGFYGRPTSAPRPSGGRGEPAISLTPSTTKPYWACPEGPCEAIIDPQPVRVPGGYALPAGGPLLEGGGVGGGYDPQDLQSAYKIPTSIEETQTIALVDAYGYASAESDLATYRKQYGLTPCTKANGCFKKVNESGEEANYPPPNSGWQVETALDLAMASAACTNPANCHILLVEATTASLENLGQSVNEAAKLGATEISNSYGLPEQLCGIGCTPISEEYYNHPGVVVTVSSGDNGYDNHLSECEVKGKLCASPNFPATSPYVVAVGGTSLHKASNSRGWSEEVWTEAGSGCSKFEPKPAWQTDTGCAKRTDNDVAAVADSTTPVSVYANGSWYLVGGTSASSPLVAGIEAHASKYTRSLGAHAFYKYPGSLFDVTTGSNGTCTPPAEDEYFCHAEVGYDGPTGLGTPDGVPAAPPPTVETKAASSVTQTSATLNATVNPNEGEVSECKFEYGTTTSYGSSASCTPSPGSGTSAVGVSAAVTGLTANNTYHFRISATNPGGTSKGSDQAFTTLPDAPTVVTGTASALTQTSATLNATVNPNGGEVGECKLEYGPTEAYGSSAPCTPSPGSGTSPVAVSASVAGLAAHTAYHFRISASNVGGTGTGSDRTFTTANPHYYSNGELVGSAPTTSIAWGTIRLANVKGGIPGSFVTCHSAGAGTMFNPAGGAAGEGLTQVFATFDCESEGICPAGMSTAVVAENLPWHNILTEEVVGTIRQETTGVKLFIECLVGETAESGSKFVIGAGENGLRPKAGKGTSALHPGFFEFGEGSGELEVEGSGGAVTRRAEGAVKILGYNAQELITTNP